MPRWIPFKKRKRQIEEETATSQSTSPKSEPTTRSKKASLPVDPSRDDAANETKAQPPLIQETESIENRKIALFKNPGTLGLNVLHDPPNTVNTVVDIVFIHGSTADAFDTWFKKSTNTTSATGSADNVGQVQSQHAGVYWPVDLLTEDIKDARIIVYGYDADVTKVFGAVGQGRLREHAETLLTDLAILRAADNTEDRPIVFVAHSLGGLVTKKAVCLAESSFELSHAKINHRTIGIMFLGVPHRGSSFAPYAHGLAYMLKTSRKSVNTNIVGLLKPGSEVLADIEESFSIWLRKHEDRVQIAPFYEELELPVVGKVVDKESAKVLGYVAVPIHANHMVGRPWCAPAHCDLLRTMLTRRQKDMTKFDSDTDKSYQRVFGSLNGWLKTARQEALAKRELTQAQEECLRSLHYEAIESHRETVHDAASNTFTWVWQVQSYSTWLKQSKNLYWICGKPGSGKSTMLKYLSENVHKYDPSNAIVASHFFRFDADKLSRSMIGLFRSLLWQICKTKFIALEALMPLFQDLKKTRSCLEWHLKDLELAWTRALKSVKGTVTIFVDALDEFDGDVQNIAEKLYNISNESQANVRVCTSSRPNPEVHYAFDTCKQLVMEEHTEEDIKVYTEKVCARILREPEHDSQSHVLVKDVQHRARGVFMWVKLAAEDLIRGFSRGEDTDRLRERVSGLPSKLSSLYRRIIEDMDQLDRDDIEQLLTVVVCAEKPLTIAELAFVYESWRRIKTSVPQVRRRLQALCTGLLEERDNTVRLYHETVLTFMRTLPVMPGAKFPNRSLDYGHCYLLNACILRVRKLGSLPSSGMQPHLLVNEAKLRKAHTQIAEEPLLRYAILYWQVHTNKVSQSRELKQNMMKEPWLSSTQYIVLFEHFLAVCWEEGQLADENRGSVLPIQITLLQLLITQCITQWPERSGWGEYWQKVDYRFAMNNQILSFSRPVFSATEQVQCRFKDFNHRLAYGVRTRDKIFQETKPLYQSPASFVQLKIEHLKRNIAIPGVGMSITPNKIPSQQNEDDQFLFVRTVEQETIELDHITKSILTANDLYDMVKIYGELSSEQESPETQTDLSNIVQHVMDYGIPKYVKGVSAYDPGTPLQYAVYHTLPIAVHALLARGANPNHQSPISMYGTPLVAAIYGLEQATQRGGGAIELGFTPQIAIIGLLLQVGANPNLVGNGLKTKLQTPLEAACRIYKKQVDLIRVGNRAVLQVIKLLLQYKAVPNNLIRALVQTIRDRELRAAFYNMPVSPEETAQEKKTSLTSFQDFMRDLKISSDASPSRAKRPKSPGIRPEHDGAFVNIEQEEEIESQLNKDDDRLQVPRNQTFSAKQRSYSVVYGGGRNGTFDGAINRAGLPWF